jgi:hypothetical protein
VLFTVALAAALLVPCTLVADALMPAAGMHSEWLSWLSYRLVFGAPGVRVRAAEDGG